MAQAGIYAPSTIVEAEVIVRVNGIVREHASMDWAGDTTGGLPDQVVSAGTGMKSRTGTIQWAPDASVEADPPHPLHQAGGWPPREGDEVVIDATVDTGQGPYTFRRFTGRLGHTTGSLINGTLTSEITDTLADSLNAMVTVPPNIVRGGHYMRSHWTVYQALAQAGLAAIPAPDADTVLWNGLQGGTWPTVGGYVREEATGFGDGYGLSSWSGTTTVPDGTARGGRDVLILARAGTGAGGGPPEVLVHFGSRQIGLSYSLTTGMYSLREVGVAGTFGSWPRVDNSPMAVLALQVRASGVRVYTSPTTWVNVPGLSVPTSAEVTKVGGTLLTGVSVRYMSGAAAPGVVARTTPLPVSIDRSLLEQEQLPATRGFENVTARSVVDAWSEATLGSVWMDEHGKPVMVARDRLVARPVARTLRIDERVVSGSWSVGDDSVHSQVVVAGLRATVSSAGGLRTTLYQPANVQAIDAEEPMEQIIRVPDHEDWIDLDTDWRPVRKAREGIVNDADFAARDGSFWQIVFADPDDGDRYRWTGSEHQVVSASIERLGQRAVKLTHLVTGDMGAGLDYYLASPTVGITYSLPYRGVPMPILRGRALVSWTEYAVTAGGGPSWAPPLEHSAGWWLTPGDAQRVADALAAEVTEAMPTLSGVTVLWDPTRQIGDVEEWTAVDKAGQESWRARVLVTGYSEGWDGNVPTQSVDVRVISWTDPADGKTYNDLSKAYTTYAGMAGTYQQTLDALPGTV